MIFLGSDHRGFQLKERVKQLLAAWGHRVEDLGTHGPEPVDYPDLAAPVAWRVAEGRGQGILICGTGIGMSVAANKVPGVRAALCLNRQMAAQGRAHLDANVLVLGAEVVPLEELEPILRAWLSTPFEGGRHRRRLAKIERIERRCWERAGA